MSQPKDALEKLNQEIALLTLQQSNNKKALKLQVYETYESFKPVNLINNLIDEAKEDIELPEGAVGSAAIFMSNLLNNVWGLKNSKNPYKVLLGNVVNWAVLSLASVYGKEMPKLLEKLNFFDKKSRKKKKSKTKDDQ
jgi:hypothetical protein